MKSILALLVLVFVVAACDTTTPESAGQQMALSDFSDNPGYAWYQTEIAAYQPSTPMVDSITKSFNASEQKICIFVRPSCGCRGTQRLFPQIMKTLIDAKIDMSKVELWSMRNPGDNTPYKSQMHLTSLPSIVILRNGTEAARIIDADYNEVNADTLIATAIAK